MILIVVVDDNMGMLFNRRRQSQDRMLNDKILELTEASCLWTNRYTAALFREDKCPQLNIDENCLREAAPGEYCFVEDLDISSAEKWIEKIILFHWNRSYPADLFFPLSLEGWKMTGSQEFSGYSHEKITMEVYNREKSS